MAIDETLPFLPVRIAVLTVSDTRTHADDRSGDDLVQRIEAAGHIVAARLIERDDRETLVSRLHAWIDDPEVDCIMFTRTDHFCAVCRRAIERIVRLYSRP